MLIKLNVLTIFFALVSLSIWIYGNSIEQNDMSNAGLQVFGFLGTIFFSSILIILIIIKGKLRVKNKK